MEHQEKANIVKWKYLILCYNYCMYIIPLSYRNAARALFTLLCNRSNNFQTSSPINSIFFMGIRRKIIQVFTEAFGKRVKCSRVIMLCYKMKICSYYYFIHNLKIKAPF